MISRNDISSTPLLPITFCYIFGIILYVYGWGLPSIIILTIISVVCLIKNLSFSIFSIAAILGICQSYTFIPLEANPELIGKEFVFSGIIEDCKDAESVQSMILQLDSAGSSPKQLSPINKTLISLQYPDFIPEFEKGQRLVFKCTPEKITSQYDLPDEIDPSDLLIKKNVYLRAIITTDNIYSIRNATGLIGKLTTIRSNISRNINDSSLSPEAKELLIAMLTGETSTLSENIKVSFRKAGISHLLAISGLHVGIISFIISLALWPLYIAGYGKIRWILTIAFIWIFAIKTGMAPSVTRAVIMATTYLIAKLIQRNSPPLNSLCLAALIILLFSPESLFNTGFQLSFAAVAAILVFANRLNPINPRKRIAHSIMSYITVSVSAIIGTGIVSIFYFHSFPVYFLLSNVLISLILPFCLGSGIITIAISAIGAPSTAFSGFVDICVASILRISQFVAGLPGSNIDNLYFPAYMIIPYLILLLAFKITLDKPNRTRITVTSGLTLLFTILTITISHSATPIESVLYLSRDYRHTELVLCDSRSGLTIITNTPTEPHNIRSRAEFRYVNYMGKRNIDSILIDTANRHSDRLIIIGDKKVALLSGKPNTIPNEKINYLIVSKGYRGDMKRLNDSYQPDTIIISADIHPKRAARYAAECCEIGLPFILARQRPWTLSYSSSLYPIIK